MKTGRKWGRAPGFFLTGDPEWRERDRIAAMGWELYESELCPHCGHHVSICRDPGMAGRFGVEETTCHAKAALDQHQQDQKGDPEPGQLFYATPEASKSGEHAIPAAAPPPGMFDD